MNVCLQRFHFEPGTLIEYDGYSVIVAGSGQAGLIVRDRFVGDDEIAKYYVLTDGKVQEIVNRFDVVIDTDFSKNDPDDPAFDVAQDDEVLWENRSEADKKTAFQREAWCLATRTILRRPPYTETLVDKHYRDIKEAAHDRQRLNELGEIKNGAYFARSWGAKSVSNFCKTYFSAKVPHPKLLLSKKLKGNTLSELTGSQNALLDKCCQSYLSKAQPSKASIVKLVKKAFRHASDERRRNGDARPFNAPHPNTVYRRLAKFSRLHLVISREGFRAALKEFSPTQHGVRALKPGELIELDFWKGDVFTLSKKGEFWDLLAPDLQKKLKEGEGKGKKKTRQRLWVCAAIDVATRMILGVGLAATPNVRTVIEVLDMVTRDKSDISRLADCKMPWSQHTGLGTIIVDTGAEFFNEEVQAAILAMGGAIVFGRAGVPMDKPFIERFFGGLRTMFADELPGKTGYSIDCLIDYDSEGMAAFNSDEFRHLLIKYIVDSYPLEEHAGLFGQRPIEAWKTAQKYGALAPPLPRVRRNATGLKVKRVMSKEGIRILGIPFGNQGLFPKYSANGKFEVDVRIDPNDLREVTVLIEGKQVHLENQRRDLAHHSLRTLMAAIKKMSSTKPRDKVFYEYVLSEYSDWFTDKIAVGIDAHGLPSTEISAETLEYFEQSFCMKLQIDKNPDQVTSVDFDQLLSGGSGQGIHSADDIAEEQEAKVQLRQDDACISSGVEPTEPAEEFASDEGPNATSHLRASMRESLQQKKTKPKKIKSKSTRNGRYSGKPKGKGSFE
ncbi:MAG: hypothetical protein ABJZ56_03525 [Paracoccaceae bacterium]